jgi:hypothetical protein
MSELPRRDWAPIIERARALVTAFEQRFDRPPTLRRNHYELVSDMSATEAGYRNTVADYMQASAYTGLRMGFLLKLIRAGRLKSLRDGRIKVRRADLDNLTDVAELAAIAEAPCD